MIPWNKSHRGALLEGAAAPAGLEDTKGQQRTKGWTPKFAQV